MITPGSSLNLRPLRWVPFKYQIRVDAYDLTSATFVMEVRSYKGAPGDPLIALANASSPTQGISVSVVTTGGVPASTIEIRIDETTIEGLLPFTVTSGSPNRVPPGADVEIYYDILITPSGGTKARWFEGTFTIVEGVTKNV